LCPPPFMIFSKQIGGGGDGEESPVYAHSRS
jgi:hypothetical protein